jgi:hypothetical protein
MSEEYEVETESTFSPFWPLLILVVGLNLWLGYQVLIVGLQQHQLNEQFFAPSTQQTLQASKNWQDRYGAILKDLNDNAKDPAAASILKDAVQAGIQSGLIRVQPGTNTTATPAAPTPSK